MDKKQLIERAAILVGNVDDLPTIPAVATQVIQLLDDPDVSIEDVADLMLKDQVMTARVLKLINSPVYKPTHAITSLKRALMYLGLRHVRELALTTSVINAFDSDKGVLGLTAFWEHSFGVGMVSRIIAQKVGYRDSETAYIAGIVHDLGEVFLSNYQRKPFEEVLEIIKDHSIKLIDAEQNVLGTTHCEIGYCMARAWNFPPVYCEVISCHHAPGEAVIDPVLSALVNLADLFCSVRGFDYGGREWVSFNLHEEQAWKTLKQISPALAGMDVERFCYELDDAVPEIRELLSSVFSTAAKEQHS